ncbi:hypothetical protein ACJX0J_024802, partial [Zea mays]
VSGWLVWKCVEKEQGELHLHMQKVHSSSSWYMIHAHACIKRLKQLDSPLRTAHNMLITTIETTIRAHIFTSKGFSVDVDGFFSTRKTLDGIGNKTLCEYMFLLTRLQS